MFKISYKDLRTESLHRAIQKISHSTSYKNIAKLKKVAALVKAMDYSILKTQKEWVNLASKYIKKDVEKGVFLIDKTGPTWLEGVDPILAEKELDEFSEREAIINAEQITAHDIETVELCPSDLVALNAVLK